MGIDRISQTFAVIFAPMPTLIAIASSCALAISGMPSLASPAGMSRWRAPLARSIHNRQIVERAGNITL